LEIELIQHDAPHWLAFTENGTSLVAGGSKSGVASLRLFPGKKH